MEHDAITVAPAGVPSGPPPPKSRRWLWIGVGASVMFAIALVIVIAIDRETRWEQHAVAGYRYAADGQRAAAVIEFKNAIRFAPEARELRLALGRVYAAQRDYESARKEIEKARDLGLDGEELNLLYVESLLGVGDNDAAEKLLEELRGSGDVSTELLVVHGRVLSARNDCEAARGVFAQALERDPQAPEALLGLARCAERDGARDDAQSYLTQVLVQAPDHSEALALQGHLKLLDRDFGAAIADLERAVAGNPRDLAAQFDLVRALIADGRDAQAGDLLDGMEKSAERDPATIYLRGLMAYKAKRLDEARAEFSEVLLRAPAHQPSLLLLGHTLYLQDDVRASRDYLAQFVGLAPRIQAARELLAMVHMRLGEPASAVAVLQPIEDVARLHPPFLTLLGTALVQAGDRDAGTRMLAEARRLAPDSESIQIQVALTQFVVGNVDEALLDLDAIAAGSGSPRADYLLIYAHLQRGRGEEALTAAKALISQDPTDPMAFNLAGMAYLAASDFVSARQQFEAALAARASFVPALNNLGELDRMQGDVAQARARFAESLRIDPGNADTLMALSRMESAIGATDAAVSWLEQAVAANPAAIEPRLHLAQQYLGGGRVEQARALTRQAAAFVPRRRADRMLLGHLYLALRDSAAAKTTFTDLAQAYPDWAEPKLALATLAIMDRDPETAERLGRHVLESAPDEPQALEVLARVAVMRRAYEQAFEFANRILARIPNDPSAAVLIGDIQIAQGDYLAALATFRRIAESAPNTASMLKTYQVQRLANQADEARRTLELWLADHPDDGSARHALASWYLEHDSPSEAIGHYRIILEHDPGNVSALNNLANLQRSSDPAQALRDAEAAYGFAPNDHRVLDTYGWLLIGADQDEKGLALLAQAAAQAGGDPEIEYHYAAALARAGDRSQAASRLEALLAAHPGFPERSAAESLLALLR